MRAHTDVVVDNTSLTIVAGHFQVAHSLFDLRAGLNSMSVCLGMACLKG